MGSLDDQYCSDDDCNDKRRTPKDDTKVLVVHKVAWDGLAFERKGERKDKK